MSLPLTQNDATASSSPRTRAGTSLRRNVSWMLAGNIVYAGCQWGILSLMTRLGTPEIVGQFVFALALTAPVMSLFLLQARSVQATDTRRQFQFGHYLALRLISLGLALLTLLGIGLFFRHDGQSLSIILAVAFSASADGLSDTAYGLLQQREKLDRIARSMMLRGVLSLTVIGTTLALTQQLGLALLAGAVVRLVIFAGFDLIHVRHALSEINSDWRPVWDIRALASLAVLAAPLGVVMMLVTFNNNLPRYFIEWQLDSSSLGAFGAIGYLSVIGGMFIGALGESATPRLARAFAAQDRGEFLRLYLRLLGLGALVGIGAVLASIVAGPQILTLLYGPAYAEYSSILVWTMTAAAAGYLASLSGYAVTAARYFRAQTFLFLIVAAVNAAACSWLVPRYGLFGAAWSLLAAAAVQLLGFLLMLGHGLALQAPPRPARPLTVLEPITETA